VNALEILKVEQQEFEKVGTYLQLSNDEFLLQHSPGRYTSSKRLAVVIVKELVSAIVDRSPLVRCYAFEPGLVKGLEPDSEEFRARWKKLKPKVGAKRERRGSSSESKSLTGRACFCVGLDKPGSRTH